MLATVKFGVLFEARDEFLTILNTICDFKWTTFLSEISSSHGGEYDVQSCLLGCTAV
jgi:hypothetical protein